MTGFFILMLIMGAGPAICAWLLVTALRSGVIRARSESYSRSKNPISFWFMAAIYAGLILFVGTLMIQEALKTFVRH